MSVSLGALVERTRNASCIRMEPSDDGFGQTVCAHQDFALQLQLTKTSLATAACSGSRGCVFGGT